MKQLVILAGGRGTRLTSNFGAKPKPMASVGGKPVIDLQLQLAKTFGFFEVHLLLCHQASVIKDHLGDGSQRGIRIHYHIEPEPLGTAGAVLRALPVLADKFVLMYGDTVLDVDLDQLWKHHEDAAADATLFVHPNDHPYDSDLVEMDAAAWIWAFHPHPRPPQTYLQNRVNAGLYVLEKRALEPWSRSPGKLDFAHDLFPRMLAAGARLSGHKSREYIKDMGTPDRLARVEGDMNSGLIERLALRNPCPAVFLDRDGTLNVEVDRITDPAQLELIDGAVAAVKRLNRAGMLAVVITNQPVIARGDCTEETLRLIHNKLESLLGCGGAYLDGLYYCPHHPDRGFPGERTELKIFCDCRKPGIALIQQAAAELNIALQQSWLIGDSSIDLQAARNAGMKAVLVRTGHGGRDRRCAAQPDFEFDNVADAVDFICDSDANRSATAASAQMIGASP
jgi:histidinol-phosphate phosphatase family protein